MSDRDKNRWTKPPDYDERLSEESEARAMEEALRMKFRKRPTGEISLDDIRKKMKHADRFATAKTIGLITGLLTAASTGTAGIIKAFAAHDRVDVVEKTDAKAHQRNEDLFDYRFQETKEDIAGVKGDVDTLRDRVENLRVRQASCCARKREDP